MAFKMKGSPYAAGRHATKQTKTMAYQVHSHPGAKEPHDPMKKHNPPLHMKSPLTQSDYDRKEGFTYGDEKLISDVDGVKTYQIEGDKPGGKGYTPRGSFSSLWEEMSPEEKSKYGGFEDYVAKGQEWIEEQNTPGETDVLTRTEGPKIDPITLPRITPNLNQEIDMEPELAKMDQKKFNKMMKKRRLKQEKERKQNRLIPRIGRGIRDIDLVPGDPNSRRRWRRKTGRKIGRGLRKLNPKNWIKSGGNIGCPGV